MLPDRIVESFNNLGNALERLGEVVDKSPDPERIIIDSTIQRFEFTFELFWKHLKRLAVYSGRDPKTPRETLQEAYSFGWIDGEKIWLEMMNDRNSMSHIYKEELADHIYANIKRYYPTMQRAYDLLRGKFLK